MRKKPESCSCWLPLNLPDIIQGDERGVSLVFLPGIDGVSEIGEVGVGGIRSEDWDQSGDIGRAIIADAKQREPVLADVETRAHH